MARLNTFKIQFHSFQNGSHELVFDVDDAFFTYFTESEIARGQVAVRVLMIKSERQLRFDFHLEGSVMVPCDRCLDLYEQDLDSFYTLYGKFGSGNSDDELDVVWIPESAGEVDLAGYVYEYIMLSLPLKRMHPDNEEGESGCDPEMLDRLSEFVITSDE